ncbi:type VII secretion protein EccB [Micromonospora sp. Llam7]|uniref:type VII secretion protein EccB n=1 Tax=Micromonospora tarapacensis TaxID=2835305 RepID=UPI001C837CE2|nr:type VII secretion protein EccB [Micromonospora tarapacensis]MBX7266395.1 type VII secretion protein EccB [Micromonospora tarapacensis]
MTAMQSRRDQVQAQSYLLGRLTKAVVTGHPDAPESPTRRLVVGNVAGLLVACLVLAGFAVYGYLSPGGASAWREPGVLVLERDTGSRYVRDSDGLLRPVLNLASARLLLGADPKVVKVSADSLRGVGHGTPVGIVGAPDSLPGTATAAALTWTACTVPPPGVEAAAAAAADDPGPGSEPGSTGTGSAPVILRISVDAGAGAGAGAPAGGNALDARSALVAGYGPERFLVYNGRRHRFTEPWLPRALGFDDTAIAPAAEAWLRTIPAGPDITPIRPTGPSERTIGTESAAVGRVYVVHGPGGADRYYLVTDDGLAPLTELAYRIVLGDPTRSRLGLNVEAVVLPPAVLSATTMSRRQLLPAELPTTVPAPVVTDPGQVPCLRYRPAATALEILMDSPGDTGRLPALGVGVTASEHPARAIVVDADAGGLFLAGWPGQAPDTTRYLLTDVGVRFPVGSAEAAARLGYPDGVAVAVPPPLLDLLPTGPLLDPEVIES